MLLYGNCFFKHLQTPAPSRYCYFHFTDEELWPGEIKHLAKIVLAVRHRDKSLCFSVLTDMWAWVSF